MKKFKFRLATLEKYRKQQEEEAIKHVAETQKLLKGHVDHKQALDASLLRAFKRREGAGRDATNVVDLATEENFIMGTKIRIVTAERHIERATRSVNSAITEYMEARKKRMMMETLREKDFVKYKKKLAQKEMKDQDDLYVMRAKQGAAS